jgi:ATP phosphoribosyltransferase
VPAPLLLQDAAAEISARGSEDLRAKFGTIATSYVPHMMSYFDVCLHERDCPAFNADHEQESALCNWNLQVAALRGRAELYTVARAADCRGPSLGGLKYRARMAG